MFFKPFFADIHSLTSSHSPLPLFCECQSTTWVKRESEKIAADPVADKGTPVVLPALGACYSKNETHASYATQCSELAVPLSAGAVGGGVDDNASGGSSVADGAAGDKEKEEL